MVILEKQEPFIYEHKNKQRFSIGQKIKIAFLLIFVTVAIIYQAIVSHNHAQQESEFYHGNYFALLGDIGGTNIRFQLVQFNHTHKLPIKIHKQQRMKVKDYQKFQESISQFLKNITQYNYPTFAVIAAAGPVSNNKILLTNVQKWGLMKGQQLGYKFNVSKFLFINDFEAVSYGLQIIQDDQFINLNGKYIDSQKIRGVIGPGTGLGHSIILRYPQNSENTIVLPSQAGHADVPLIDQQAIQYINFLKVRMNLNYITLEKAFCGPSIPYMFEFYAQKLNLNYSLHQMTSQKIVQECVKQFPQPVFYKTFNLFIKFYSSAIGNFIIQHMTSGGIYLIGGLTKTLIQKIKRIDMLKEWKLRHPESTKIVENIPLVFCNQVDLGLRGSYVMAKRLSKNNKKFNKNNQDAF